LLREDAPNPLSIEDKAFKSWIAWKRSLRFKYSATAALKSNALCLGVLPTLVDRLEAIAVGIENVRGIVARIII